MTRPVIGCQIVLLHTGQLALQGGVAVKKERAVGGVIVCRVEAAKGLVAQVRNAGRIAAGLVGIGGAGQKALEHVVHQRPERIGKSALHFIEDHAAKLERPGLILQMQVPALLGKGAARQQRMQHHVAVHVHDAEILVQVAGGKGVVGAVRAGHGIQKGQQAALVDFAEHIAHRIFFRAHEHRMLDNVGHAGGILRHGTEGNTEGLVRVLVFDGQGPAAQNLVGQKKNFGINFIQPLPAFQPEAAAKSAFAPINITHGIRKVYGNPTGW